MKILTAILLSSVLILGACGTTDSQDENETNGNQVNEDVSDNGNQEGSVDNEADVTEADPDSESGNNDQLNFTYSPEEVRLFDLSIELSTDEEWNYDFERDDQEAKIEHENGSESEREGAEAFEEIEQLLAAIQVNHERTINEMIDEILDYLEINRDDMKEIDLEIETITGEKIGFKYQRAERGQSATITDFDLDIEFLAREEWDYEYELNDEEFSIEYSDRDNLSGQEARDEIERILADVSIDLDQSIGDLQNGFFSAIDVDSADIEEWHFEVEFEDQSKISTKFDRS